MVSLLTFSQRLLHLCRSGDQQLFGSGLRFSAFFSNELVIAIIAALKLHGVGIVWTWSYNVLYAPENSHPVSRWVE